MAAPPSDVGEVPTFDQSATQHFSFDHFAPFYFLRRKT